MPRNRGRGSISLAVVACAAIGWTSAFIVVLVGCLSGLAHASSERALRSRAGASLPFFHPSWNGDFATGDWSQYDDCRANHVDGVWPFDYAIDTIVGSLGRRRCSGSRPRLIRNVVPPLGFLYAARYTVRSADRSYERESGERTLDTVLPSDNDAGVHGKSRAHQGADSWYRDDVYFPSDFRPTRNNDWNVLYELHNYPDDSGDANLALMIVTDNSDGGPHGHERLSVRILGGGSPSHPIDGYGSSNLLDNRAVREHWFLGPSLRRDRWYDLVFHVHWDWRANADRGKGFVEYWIDGRRIGSYRGPTLFWYDNNGTGRGGPGQAYIQHGIYRPTDSTAGYAQPTVSVYHAATMVGPTAESIGETLL